MITIILILALITLVIVFSVQNAEPVAVTLLLWKTDASLAIVIFLSVVTGIFIGVIAMSYWMVRRAVHAKKRKKPEETLPGGPNAREAR